MIFNFLLVLLNIGLMIFQLQHDNIGWALFAAGTAGWCLNMAISKGIDELEENT